MDNYNVSNRSQDDSEAVTKAKLSPSRLKYRLYEEYLRDRKRPFTGYDCHRLRQFMDISVKRMADLVGCVPATIHCRESDGKPFGVPVALRFHRLQRYAELAKKDLRDRVEMPDFNR